MSEVYLNGKYAGEVDSGEEFATKIREERRRGAFSHTGNVYYDSKIDAVYVETGSGRTRRPLIVVKDSRPQLTERHLSSLQKGEISWNDLIEQGVIEFLDAAEEENCFIAFSESEITPDNTHVEISPLSILGLTTSLVPYANFMPGSRVSIAGKNQKHAIGLYMANYPVRMDMDVNVLHYPQRPIVSTITHDLSGFDHHAHGQNVVVAVMCYKGYNMEDAVILNEASVQMGFGRSTYFRPANAEELRYSGGLTDEVAIPSKDVKGYKSEKDYRYLEDDGIVYPEARVREEDVIIGKTSPPRFLSSVDEYSLSSNIRRESSVVLKHGEEGIVDCVLLTENGEGNKMIQVRIRDTRTLEIGDKYISRHGQKGVIGLIVPESDLPFTAGGTVPDVIFSPHSLPSRMTVSHMLELLGAKVGSLAGRYVDGTCFAAEPEMALRNELVQLGFRDNGTETMYNGITGERMECRIFVGNQYYLKLKHMVANKIQSRARGPIQLLTRQPTEGRAKEGGLRLGEMEKDTFVAHGASLLLKERFDSDKTVVPVCENCGIIAIHDLVKEKRYCPICGDNVEVTDVEISYAFKLILDEFKSLGIYPKIILKTKY